LVWGKKIVYNRKVMMEKQKYFLDELSRREKKALNFDLPLFKYVKKYKNQTLHFSIQGPNQKFYTEDSRRYHFRKDLPKIRKQEKICSPSQRLDGIIHRDFSKNMIYPIGKSDLAILSVRRRYSAFRSRCLEKFANSVKIVSPVKMWNFSLVGAIIFGMLTMTMIYRYLGENVSAKIQEEKNIALEEFNREPEIENFSYEIDVNLITNLLKDYQANESGEFIRKKIADDIMAMVKGYPIEVMVPEIAKRDRMIAALLVAIARKESQWGKRVPVLNGEDCYNYWGYRGIRPRMGTGGHTCFDSPEDAVNTVAKRIETLVNREGLNTPAKMVVWKCGYDCSWDSKTAIQKWISDVDFYFQKLKD